VLVHAHASPQVQGCGVTLAHPQEVFSQRHWFRVFSAIVVSSS
jgi:hypothetical protein